MNTEISIPFKEISFPTPRQMTLRQARRHKGFLFGGGVLLLIIIMALLAPLLAPHDPYHQDLSKRLTPPIWHAKGTWDHPLGTDNLGRDYLSRLMYGARISLIIGVAAMLISGLIGTTLGVLAGFFGGRVDMVVNALITIADRGAGPGPDDMEPICFSDARVNPAAALDGLYQCRQSRRLFNPQNHPD
jgi:peptide/nickel transport system permease protein